MSDSAANGIVENRLVRGNMEKSARIAALFTLLGTDCLQNLHTIVTQSREIFAADFCIYLATDIPDQHLDPGCRLPDRTIGQLMSWTQTLPPLPPEEGMHLISAEKMPREAALDCRTLACIPAGEKENTLGMLVAGFKTVWEPDADDHHAASCLSGVLGFQQRIHLRSQNQAHQVHTGCMARQVAHDLNNILASLVSYPDLILMQMEASDPFWGPVSLMHEAGIQAAEMVRDFLTLARPRAEQTFYRISPSASTRAYCQTSAYAQLTSAYPQVRFSFQIASDLPDIPGSDDFLPKIFTTLLSHGAQNLTGPGQVTVTLKEYLQENQSPLSSQKGLLLRVEDDGPRTDEKDLIHLFDPFYAKKSMGRQGTGLELAAVKKLILDQGGMITATSNPDRGTRFDAFLRAIS